MQHLPDLHFWFCIFALDRSHVFATYRWAVYVGQSGNLKIRLSFAFLDLFQQAAFRDRLGCQKASLKTASH